MNDANNQPGFPLAQSAACLTATAAVCLAGAWGVITMLYRDIPDATAAVCLAGTVVWGASILGMIPVALLGKQGVMATVGGYFTGMGIRLALCLGLYMVVASRDSLRAEPVAVVLVMMYVPLLFVETALVAKYLWAKDFLSAGTGIGTSGSMPAVGGGTDAKGAWV